MISLEFVSISRICMLIVRLFFLLFADKMRPRLMKRMMWSCTFALIAILLVQNAVGQSNYASHANNVEYLGEGLPGEATLDGKVSKKNGQNYGISANDDNGGDNNNNKKRAFNTASIAAISICRVYRVRGIFQPCLFFSQSVRFVSLFSFRIITFSLKLQWRCVECMHWLAADLYCIER